MRNWKEVTKRKVIIFFLILLIFMCFVFHEAFTGVILFVVHNHIGLYFLGACWGTSFILRIVMDWGYPGIDSFWGIIGLITYGAMFYTFNKIIEVIILNWEREIPELSRIFYGIDIPLILVISTICIGIAFLQILDILNEYITYAKAETVEPVIEEKKA